MKVIIVGLGRMGTGLAKTLDKKGHEVTVIDQRESAFEKLGSHFTGQTVVGIGFDKDVLEKAGIDRVDAVVATTATDDANALIARIAKNHYRVPRVIARLYDERKAEIYHRLGIRTIATTTWGIEHTVGLLTYQELDPVLSVGGGTVNIVSIEVPALLVGKMVEQLTSIGEVHLTAINRNNKAFLPTQGTVLESGDLLYLAVALSATPRLNQMLGITTI